MTPIVIDSLLHGCGGIILAWAAWRSVASGEWRDPLQRSVVSPAGPTLALILLIFVVNVGLFGLLSPALQSAWRGPPGATAPALQFHATLAADGLAKLGAAVLALVLMGASPPVIAARVSVVTGLGWALGGVLVARALTTLQLNMQMALWQLWTPEASVPLHPILAALQDDPRPPWGRLHLWVHAVVVAPVAEEVFFRGVILGALLNLLERPWLAVLIAAVPFGLVHMGVQVALLPMTTFALLLGFVYVRTGSLSACIAVHVLFNAWTMIGITLGA